MADIVGHKLEVILPVLPLDCGQPGTVLGQLNRLGNGNENENV